MQVGGRSIFGSNYGNGSWSGLLITEILYYYWKTAPTKEQIPA
jgi:hypothetical protein